MDVLQADDAVVDEHPDPEGDTTEGHQVERDAEELEEGEGGESKEGEGTVEGEFREV